MSNSSKIDKLKNIIAILESELATLEAWLTDLKYNDKTTDNALITDLCSENKKLKVTIYEIGKNNIIILNLMMRITIFIHLWKISKFLCVVRMVQKVYPMARVLGTVKDIESTINNTKSYSYTWPSNKFTKCKIW